MLLPILENTSMVAVQCGEGERPGRVAWPRVGRQLKVTFPGPKMGCGRVGRERCLCHPPITWFSAPDHRSRCRCIAVSPPRRPHLRHRPLTSPGRRPASAEGGAAGPPRRPCTVSDLHQDSVKIKFLEIVISRVVLRVGHDTGTVMSPLYLFLHLAKWTLSDGDPLYWTREHLLCK